MHNTIKKFYSFSDLLVNERVNSTNLDSESDIHSYNSPISSGRHHQKLLPAKSFAIDFEFPPLKLHPMVGHDLKWSHGC